MFNPSRRLCFNRPWLNFSLVTIAILALLEAAQAAPMTFNFTLNSGYTTSGGAYKPDGTLVKTLWRKVYYGSGTHSFTWDGKDDDGNDMPNGNYDFKVIAHNVKYAWDGAIGNSSQHQSGTTVHRSFHPMRDMAINGQDAVYVAGYNEGNYLYARFDTSNPQVVTGRRRWVYHTNTQNPQYSGVQNKTATYMDRDWNFTATDGTWAYFAAAVGTHPTTRENTYPGFVTAIKMSDNSLASFSSGSTIPVGLADEDPIANGIYVGTQPEVSGLAVQKDKDLLAVAVKADDKVYFFNKRSGASAGSLSVTDPSSQIRCDEGRLLIMSFSRLIISNRPSSHRI